MLPGEQQPISADGPPPSPHQVSRNSAYGTIAGLCTAIGSVLANVIVAHMLGVEGTGVIVFALWMAMLAADVTDLGAQATLARYLPELTLAGRAADGDRRTARLRAAVALACCAALAGFASYGGWEWWAGGAEPAISILVGVACALQALAGFTYGYLRGVQRFDHLALVTAVSLAAQLVFVAVGSLTFGLPGALVGYCTGSVLPAALALRAARRTARGPGPLAADIRRRARRYALYAWAGALSSAFVWSRAEVFFLNRSAGSAAVGFFTAGVTPANLAPQEPII